MIEFSKIFFLKIRFLESFKNLRISFVCFCFAMFTKRTFSQLNQKMGTKRPNSLVLYITQTSPTKLLQNSIPLNICCIFSIFFSKYFYFQKSTNDLSNHLMISENNIVLPSFLHVQTNTGKLMLSVGLFIVFNEKKQSFRFVFLNYRYVFRKKTIVLKNGEQSFFLNEKLSFLKTILY